MRILSNGNVGIGTNSPDYKLDVSGNVNINGILTGDDGTYFPIRHKDFTSYSQLLFRNSGHVYLGGGELRFCIGNPSVNTNEKMRIHDNGYVGIGTTNPGTPLDVQVAPTRK